MSDKTTKILVIDDEPMIREIIMAFLVQWGYTSFEAENGQVGLDIFGRESIDLVLTDLDMPKMGGLEVLAYIHEHSPETPVVIISGAGQLDDAVQSIKLGAWDYLTKPIANMVILENTIDRCLEKVHLLQENRRYQLHLEEEVALKTDELRQKNVALEEEVAERRQKEEEVRRINSHLENIVDASGRLFGFTTIELLLEGVLLAMHYLLHEQMGEALPQVISSGVNGFVVFCDGGSCELVSGIGRYVCEDEGEVGDLLPGELYDRLCRVQQREQSEYGEEDFFGFIRTPNGYSSVLYLDGCRLSREAEQRLITIYLNNVASAIDSLALQEEIHNTQKELVITLGEVIETRSHEAANHVRRVAEYTYLLARKYGMGEQEAKALRFASPMHDAGKIGIPDALLNKPGRLTDQEMGVMHGHTVMGFDLLKNSQRQILQMAAIVAHQHHERWDGHGYPQGLEQQRIHIYGRIVALADVFDALGTERCYKPAWPFDEVVALIRRERGSHFDPELVDILLDNLDDFKRIRELYPDQ